MNLYSGALTYTSRVTRHYFSVAVAAGPGFTTTIGQVNVVGVGHKVWLG